MRGVNIGLISAAPDVVEHPALAGNHRRVDVRSCVLIGVEPGTCLRFRIARIELLRWIAPCRAINQAAVVGPGRADHYRDFTPKRWCRICSYCGLPLAGFDWPQSHGDTEKSRKSYLCGSVALRLIRHTRASSGKCAGSTVATGRRMVNVEPRPTSLSTSIEPWCSLITL